MSKLDEHGLLTDEAVLEAHRELWGNSPHQAVWLERLILDAIQHGAKAERDELLEMVSQWLEEADATKHYKPHYVEKQIAKLKGGDSHAFHRGK